jgi:hypothetical protein
MKGSKYKKTSIELLDQKHKLKGIVKDVNQENIKLKKQISSLQIENEKLNAINEKSEENKRKEIYDEIYATKQEEMRINLKTEEKEAIKELQKQLKIKDEELKEKDQKFQKEKEELQRLNREQQEEIIRLKRELGLLKKSEEEKQKDVDNSPKEKSKNEMEKDYPEKKDEPKDEQNVKTNKEEGNGEQADEEEKEDLDDDKQDAEEIC